MILVLLVLNATAVMVVDDVGAAALDHPYGRWVMLDGEQNLPIAVACLQLGGCAALALLHGMLSRAVGAPGRVTWLVVGAGFAYLAVDEGLIIHERLLGVVAAAVELPDWLRFDWVVVAVPVVLLVGALLVPWLRDLPVPVRRGLIVAGTLWAGGAIVAESVGGALASRYGTAGLVFATATAVEEVLELAGAAIAIVVLLGYLRDRLSGRSLLVT